MARVGSSLDRCSALHRQCGPQAQCSTPMYVLAPASLPLDPEYEERAIYTLDGEIEIADDVFRPAQLLVFRPGDRITIWAKTNARFMMLGGEPMDGPRHIWWNFVSSRRDVSNRPKPIGRWADSKQLPVTSSSSRSPRLRWPRSRHPRPDEPSLMAGATLRGLEAHVCQLASVDANRWQNPARADALGKPLLACHTVCIPARANHLRDSVWGGAPSSSNLTS